MKIIFITKNKISLHYWSFFIVKSLGIEFLNNGAVTATLNDPVNYTQYGPIKNSYKEPVLKFEQF